MSETTSLKTRLSTYLCGNCGREFADRDERTAHFDATGHGLRRFAQAHPFVPQAIEPRPAADLTLPAENLDGEYTEDEFASHAEKAPYVSVEIEGQDEAIAYAKAYQGDFEFMVSMRAKCSKPAPRLSEKMVAGILRCKARDAAPAGSSAVKVNQFAGACGTCRNEVPAEAGRIEKVDGRWVAFHLDGSCPAEAPQSASEPRSAAPARTEASDVPEGRYAFVTDEGHVAFAKVDRPDEGRWAGRVFVNLLVGSAPDYREQAMKGAAGLTILRKIETMGVEESAALYGRKSERCGYCHAALSLLQSRAAGFGSTCAANHGFSYPSREEARRILDEEGVSLEGITDL